MYVFKQGPATEYHSQYWEGGEYQSLGGYPHVFAGDIKDSEKALVGLKKGFRQSQEWHELEIVIINHLGRFGDIENVMMIRVNEEHWGK